MNFRSLLSWGLVALAVVGSFGSCQTVRSQDCCESTGAVTRPASYVWFAEPPAGSAPCDAASSEGSQRIEIDDAALLDELRTRAQVEFAERGLSVSKATDAAYIAVPKLWVELRQESRNPMFSAVNSARYEAGSACVELFDARTGERRWCAAASTRLRDVALGYGAKVVRYAPTDEERRWRIAAQVRALFERFPSERR